MQMLQNASEKKTTSELQLSRLLRLGSLSHKNTCFKVFFVFLIIQQQQQRRQQRQQQQRGKTTKLIDICVEKCIPTKIAAAGYNTKSYRTKKVCFN